MNFQNYIASIPLDNSNDHFILVFDITSIQYAIESLQYSKVVGEPLRLGLIYTFLLKHGTELTVLRKRLPPQEVCPNLYY